jgi:transposase
MPKRLELSPHASTEELERRYRKARDPVERSHLQIVWLLSEGRTTEEVRRVTGYSPGWVRQIARRYNERGVDALGDRRHQNPGAKERALLDEAAEEELVEALQEAHPEAEEVELWAQDEARLGLKPVMRRVWAPVGERPTEPASTEARSGPISMASSIRTARRSSG